MSPPCTTPRVICPSGLQVPHVPCQTLTVPQQGRQQHPPPWRSAPASPLHSVLCWQLCAGQPRDSAGSSAPLRDRDTRWTLAASSRLSPLPSHPCRRWTMPGWRGTCTAMPASPSEVSAAPLCAGSCGRGCVAACRQPAGFPRVLSLHMDFALGLAAPRVPT